MLDQASRDGDRRWIRAMASLGVEPPKDASVDAFVAIRYLILDHGKRSSVVSCIMQARENARQVREQISNEMWEQLNRLFHDVRKASIDEMSEAYPVEFLTAVRDGAYLFQGLTDSTMSHGYCWQFIQIGRYLERAQVVSKLLDVHFAEFHRPGEAGYEAAEHLEWIGLLRSCMAFEAYCKTYTADLSADRVADFLLLNPDFPHSVRFVVDMIQSALNGLPGSDSSRKGGRVSRLAGRLRASLSFTQIDEVMGQGIHGYLESIQRQCGQIHASAYQGYIDYPIEAALQA
jgi:uncharacterized alpha-E superfamily protein